MDTDFLTTFTCAIAGAVIGLAIGLLGFAILFSNLPDMGFLLWMELLGKSAAIVFLLMLIGAGIGAIVDWIRLAKSHNAP